MCVLQLEKIHEIANISGQSPHNPEVAGSSPVSATRKPPILLGIGGFSIKKVASYFL